jgi:hypothetical protein
MRKLKNNFLLITLIVITQTNAQKQNIKKPLPQSIYLHNNIIIDKGYKFNSFKFSQSIKSQLKNYNLIIYNSDKIIDGEFYFTTNYLGKSFFKDYYIVYKNDLNKYLPKLPDFTRIHFRNKH